jgi:threonine dehydrogenase-like Zn-dependent dehydrogenase
VLVPNAQANIAKIPAGLEDEDVLLCPDIMSTGFSASARGGVRLGDAVAIFAQGPIGLCATAGARLAGASLVIGVDSLPKRLEFAKRMGADVVINYKEQDVVAEIKRLTGGGVDVAIEALGTSSTFENALRSLRPGGTLSSLGVYSFAEPRAAIARRAQKTNPRVSVTSCASRPSQGSAKWTTCAGSNRKA